MERKLQTGDQVTVHAYGGRQPTVTVVEDRGDVVLICRPSEFELAKAQKRPPLSVGFHKEDVIAHHPEVPKKGASSQASTDPGRSMAGD
jgi:hypothetical protein